MFSERTRRIRTLLVGLTAAALLLSLPATGFAAERENRSGELASAALLARGAGYGTEAGSKAVRELQLRLRRLGDRPGPVDGLYGPMTEAAVERFQRSRGLAIDGVVGPQTKRRLLAQRAEQLSAREPSPAQTGKPERKSPARDQRAESAPRQQPVQPSAGVSLGRADPESSSGLPPLLVALGAALVVAALLLSLRGRRRQAIEARLNLGLVCAALLASGVLGAAVGALFATQAAPDDDGDRRAAHSGALLASRSDHAAAVARTSPRTSSAAARTSTPTGRPGAAGRSRAKRTRSGAGTASTARAQVSPPAPAPGPATPDPGPATPYPRPATLDPAAAGPAPGPPPATTPARVPQPAAPAVPVQRPADGRRADAVAYTVRPGDALWPIARSQLAPDSSDHEVASKVADLEALNIEGRIRSGDPDVIDVGEKLRLR